MSGLPPCPHCRQPHADDVLLCPNTERLIPLAGRVLDGKFRFVKMLGEGGMGAVWMCENVLVKKTVAIKLMHVQFSKDEGVLARFRNEATAAGRIGSKHICDILDLGRSQLGPYIVMEMLDGADLAGFMQERSPVDSGTVVMAIRQALEGLQAAHAAGIVHRDLKPENIFLHEPEPGQLLVKLMDFGISKFTEGDASGKTGMGVLMGTPEYMSPEQTEGAAQADHRTDIWAMGVILYWALAGRNPFMGATMASTLLNVTTREVQSLAEAAPNLPPGLVAVVQKCIRKNPEERFTTAAEMSAALESFEDLTGAFYVPFLSKSGTTGRATHTPPPGATVASVGPPQMRAPSAPPVAAVPVAAAAAAAMANSSSSAPVLGAAGGSGGETFSSELKGAGPGAQPTMMGSDSDWGAMGGDLDSPPDSNMGSGMGGMLVIALVVLGLVGGGGWLAYRAMQDPDPTDVAANAAAAVAQQEDDAKAEAAAEAAAAEAAAAIPDLGAGEEEDSAAEAGEAESAEGGAAAEAGDAADSAAPAADGGADTAPGDGGEAPADSGADPDDSGDAPSGGGGTKPSGGGGTKPKPSGGGGTKPSGGGGTKPKPDSGGGGTKPKPDDGGSTPLVPGKPARPDAGKKKKKKKKKKKGKKKTLTPKG